MNHGWVNSIGLSTLNSQLSTTVMILRPYQTAASDAIFKEWLENDSTLVVMPTGGGKTILFADVIRRVFPRSELQSTFVMRASCGMTCKNSAVFSCQ